jgi:Protein of unknown function DUF262
MNNTLDIRSIGELLPYAFNIPDYQRGYRWQDTYQVKPLLEDIWTYQINHANPASFYCLQPVVIKPMDGNAYELIDGQQRLTTILLMLHYFNQTEFKNPKTIYSLDFSTRITQKNFLDIVDDVEKTAENIDLFHLNRAYAYISTWFETKEKLNPAIKSKFYDKLINQTKVIWYEIRDQTEVIDIFTRLNIGKIPLTNAELVKALFLSKSTGEADAEGKVLKQLRIASEWDRIEQTLQLPEFWYFICPNPDKFDTHIEYIFDLMTGKKPHAEDFHTFYKFFQEFESKKKDPNVIDEIWLRVTEYFLTFDEWFHDRELYHLIGYLVTVGKNVADLRKISQEVTKSTFKKKLRTLAKETVPKDVSDLNFEDDKNDVRRTLLLFNVLTIIDNEKCSVRFPFNHYHLQRWDIEHIRPQTPRDILGKDRLNWSNATLQYFSGLEFTGDNEAEIRDSSNNLTDAEIRYCDQLLLILKKEDTAGNIFDRLSEELASYFKEGDELEDTHGLSNLTLLDEITNRMYKNAFFPIKRKFIIEMEKRGIFIPICTKNVFLKAYSQKLGEIMYWNSNDATDYLNSIKTTLAS